jgi:hypothetical protein
LSSVLWLIPLKVKLDDPTIATPGSVRGSARPAASYICA